MVVINMANLGRKCVRKLQKDVVSNDSISKRAERVIPGLFVLR